MSTARRKRGRGMQSRGGKESQKEGEEEDKVLLLFSSGTQMGQMRGSFPGLVHKDTKTWRFQPTGTHQDFVIHTQTADLTLLLDQVLQFTPPQTHMCWDCLKYHYGNLQLLVAASRGNYLWGQKTRNNDLVLSCDVTPLGLGGLSHLSHHS